MFKLLINLMSAIVKLEIVDFIPSNFNYEGFTLSLKSDDKVLDDVITVRFN